MIIHSRCMNTFATTGLTIDTHKNLSRESSTTTTHFRPPPPPPPLMSEFKGSILAKLSKQTQVTVELLHPCSLYGLTGSLQTRR